MSSPEAPKGQSTADATGGAAVGAANRPCGTKEACSFLNKFANTQRPGQPTFPTRPDQPYWLDAFYRSYVELYLAVTRLERKEFNLPFNMNDSIVDFPGKVPPGDKAGCPPPPGFP